VRSIRLLRREFSGRLVIIDEAHNLRDTPESGEEDADNPGGDMELTEKQVAGLVSGSAKWSVQDEGKVVRAR
jgi:hypothetical protein